MRGEAFDFCVLGVDHWVIDEKGDDRCFDLLRWTLSLLLSHIMKTLPERRCVRVSRKLWLTKEIVMIGGESKEYEVYFKINKQDQRTLRIKVVSAYVRNPKYGVTKPANPPRGPARLVGKVLLYKTLRDQPIR